MEHKQYIANLPPILWTSTKFLKNKPSAVLVTSPTALSHAGNIVKRLNIIQTVFVKSSQQHHVEKLAKTPSKASVCYLLGGGQAIDIGRYLAKVWKNEVICIPSIISTDSPFVDCTGLRVNGCVKYVKSKRADQIILDRELLNSAPWRYHLSGCGDVLSIFTALYDWKHANLNKKSKRDEVYNQNIALIAQGILDSLLSEAKEIKRGSRSGLTAIITALAMEVQLCNFYGNSRPEEGGEHFFTYCIENKMKSFLHGEMVSFGTLLTGFLQGQNIGDIKEFMDTVNLRYKPVGLNRKLVIEVLKELPSYVKKHKLRFSIYNNFDYIKEQANVKRFFKLIQL